MSFKAYINYIKRYSFLLGSILIWLILCVPQNVVTLYMYYHIDPQNSSTELKNYTCYDFQTVFDLGVLELYQLRGIIIIIISSFGIVGNLFSILVLQRLKTKNGFNRLLLGLGNLLNIQHSNCPLYSL